jgi:hypothetical protein
METANLILKWTEDLKVFRAGVPFDEDDIRRDFYGFMYDISYNFYKGNLMVDLSDIFNKQKLIPDDTLKVHSEHFKRFAELTLTQEIYEGHRNWLNRSLLIDTWSNFELCTTIFCDAIISDEERTKIFKHQYSDIKKCLKTSTISDGDEQLLLTTFTKDHLAHVPITRKTDLLFNKAVGYSRNSNNDKEFLKFMGKFRNTIHTNFIYHGNNYEFKFRDAYFVFKKGEMVVWHDPYYPSPTLYLAFFDELKDIWNELISRIDHKAIIPYPVDGQK